MPLPPKVNREGAIKGFCERVDAQITSMAENSLKLAVPLCNLDERFLDDDAKAAIEMAYEKAGWSSAQFAKGGDPREGITYFKLEV